MSRFSRSIQRGKAYSAGLLQTKGQQARVYHKARRAWCRKCKQVVDVRSEIGWAKLDDVRTRVQVHLPCGTPLDYRRLYELPPGTPQDGVWLKPPNGRSWDGDPGEQ